MSKEFGDTPDIPPASALDVIRNRKVIEADGQMLDEPFSMREAVAAQGVADSRSQEPEAAIVEEPEAPQETPSDVELEWDDDDEGDDVEEQRIPKSRFDQVNVRRRTAEADLAAERTENAALKTRLAEMTRETEAVREMAKEEGFSLEQAELVSAVQDQFSELTVQEATELARARSPDRFSGGPPPQDLSVVPTSHAATVPRRTGARSPQKKDPVAEAKALPQDTYDEREAKAVEVLRAIRSRSQ